MRRVTSPRHARRNDVTPVPLLIALVAGMLCVRTAGVLGKPAGQRLAFRNLFAFNEPPPPPKVEKPPVLPTVAVASHLQPFVAQPPAAPPFPYRYIGTFGPRDNAFAVFAGEGEVINARIGDAIAERFRLRQIGLESVDLSWGGPSDLRVPLGR